jgi:7-carboxy-7-deazaguanine synthase
LTAAVAPPAVELSVSEVFGPTFQGEGPSTGRLAMFVRLGRCNLDCRWCDTPYTWDWSRFDPAVELQRRTVGDVLGQLDGINAPLLVVTGGEPLLQQRALVALLEGAAGRGWRVEVETNGTLAPTPRLSALVDQWNVSPKLANSGVELSRRWQPAAVRELAATGRAVGKFVVEHRGELDEVAELATAGNLTDVWILPQVTDAVSLRQQMQALASDVAARGWNLSGRLHIELWGNVRGV